jgi:hypothetical protein
MVEPEDLSGGAGARAPRPGWHKQLEVNAFVLLPAVAGA